MKKYSLFFKKYLALGLSLSLINGGFVSAQTTSEKPGKGGSIAVPGQVAPLVPIQLPPSQPVAPPPPPALLAVPTAPVAPSVIQLPTTPIVPEHDVHGQVEPGKGHPGKPPKPQQTIKHRRPKHPKPPVKAPHKPGKPKSKPAKTKSGKHAILKAHPKTPVKVSTTPKKAPAKNAGVGSGKQTGENDLVGSAPASKAAVSANARSSEAIDPLEAKTVELKAPGETSKQSEAVSKVSAAADAKAEGVKTESVKVEAPKTDDSKHEASNTDSAKADASKTLAIAAKDSCQNTAVKKIYDLMLHDDANTLGVMFELTAMRLAKRSLEQTPRPSSFEELTQGNIKSLEQKLSKLKSSEALQKQVQSIYETYGKKSDLAAISEDFKRMTKKNHDACYFSKNQRLKNDEASSYILAVAVTEKDSGLSDIDAATVWVVEKARAEAEKTDPDHYALGKENGNLLNMSTRVTRYLGRIDDGKNATAEFMADLIAKEEKKLVDVLAGAYTKVKAELTACLLEETRDPKTNTTCKDCAEKALQTFEKDQMGINEIQRGLLSSVAKTDNLKMEKDLKGKMGDVVYDFSNFAKKEEIDVIPPNPPRGKYDACGHSVSTAKARTTKGKVGRSPGQSIAVEPTGESSSEKPITAPAATQNQ